VGAWLHGAAAQLAVELNGRRWRHWNLLDALPKAWAAGAGRSRGEPVASAEAVIDLDAVRTSTAELVRRAGFRCGYVPS